MARLYLKFDDDRLSQFHSAIERLGSRKKTERVYRKIINRRGTRVRKGVLRALPKQTGLKSKTIRKALGKPIRASASYNRQKARLSYVLTTKGGYIGMKFFKARELKWGGVSAKPRGQRIRLPKAFIKGGRFPNRKGLRFSGTVFQPIHSGKRIWGSGKFASVKSDVRIPDEMITGESKAVYEREARGFQPEVEAEIRKLLI